MLSIWQRWRILKSIESGEPTPRSIVSALEKSPELRAYADSMKRVHEGLGSAQEVYVGVGMAERVLRAIEGESAHAGAGSRPTNSRFEPMGFIRPLGLAAAVALVSGITVLSIRPWSPRPTIQVTGEFSTLISLFQPMSDEGLIDWMDQSLTDELNAVTQDAQHMVQSVMERMPRAPFIGENQGDSPG